MKKLKPLHVMLAGLVVLLLGYLWHRYNQKKLEDEPEEVEPNEPEPEEPEQKPFDVIKPEPEPQPEN